METDKGGSKTNVTTLDKLLRKMNVFIIILLLKLLLFDRKFLSFFFNIPELPEFRHILYYT